MYNKLPPVSVYRYKSRNYMSIPDGMFVCKVKEIDGTKYGMLKKRSLVLEVLCVAVILYIATVITTSPRSKQVVQIPATFYSTENYLNVDINNAKDNPYEVLIKIKDTSGNTLFEKVLQQGESLGAIEIDNTLSTYILEYNIKWNGMLNVSKEYKISNIDYKEK